MTEPDDRQETADNWTALRRRLVGTWFVEGPPDTAVPQRLRARKAGDPARGAPRLHNLWILGAIAAAALGVYLVIGVIEGECGDAVRHADEAFAASDEAFDVVLAALESADRGDVAGVDRAAERITDAAQPYRDARDSFDEARRLCIA